MDFPEFLHTEFVSKSRTFQILKFMDDDNEEIEQGNDDDNIISSVKSARTGTVLKDIVNSLPIIILTKCRLI